MQTVRPFQRHVLDLYTDIAHRTHALTLIRLAVHTDQFEHHEHQHEHGAEDDDTLDQMLKQDAGDTHERRGNHKDSHQDIHQYLRRTQRLLALRFSLILFLMFTHFLQHAPFHGRQSRPISCSYASF